jgi:hypothetical protein
MTNVLTAQMLHPHSVYRSLTPVQQDVLTVIACNSEDVHDDADCSLSEPRIASRAGVDLAEVRPAVMALRLRGLLCRIGGYRYILNESMLWV